jgi:hypothetical protein
MGCQLMAKSPQVGVTTIEVAGEGADHERSGDADQEQDLFLAIQ